MFDFIKSNIELNILLWSIVIFGIVIGFLLKSPISFVFAIISFIMWAGFSWILYDVYELEVIHEAKKLLKK